MQNEIIVKSSLGFTPLRLAEKVGRYKEIWEWPENRFSLDEDRIAGVSEFEYEDGQAWGTFTVLKSFDVEYLDLDTRVTVRKGFQKLVSCWFMAKEDFCVACGDKTAVDRFKINSQLTDCWFKSTLECDSLNLSGITFANPKSFRLREGTVETESLLDASDYIQPQSKFKSVTFSLDGTEFQGLLKSVTLRNNGTAAIKTRGMVAMTFQTLKEIMAYFKDDI